MKKGIKKALSILLAVIITLSVAPAGAFTANAADIDYLTYKIENGEVTITDCSTEATGEITIPDEIEGAKVTKIGDNAFADCALITSVDFPSTLVSIGKLAFDECTSLSSVFIPDSVTELGTLIFWYCSSLESVSLPSTITEIPSGMFRSCSNLKSIDIPESVVEIGSSAFYQCTSVESIELPENLVTVKGFAFYGAEVLYKFPDTIETIGEKSFSRLVDSDGNKVMDITLPKNLASVGKSAFCSSLKSVYIHSMLETIGTDAFTGVGQFERFSVSADNPNFSSDEYGILYNKDKTILIKAPERSEKIDFMIPDTVVKIEDEAFEYSDFSKITIPKSLEVLGNAVFKNSTLALFEVLEDNPVFALDGNGALCSKDLKTVFSFPTASNTEKVALSNKTEVIADYAFYRAIGIVSIIVPKSVKSIGCCSFYFSTGEAYELDSVFYYGTQTEWEQISIDSGNDKFLEKERYYNYTPNTGYCGESVTWNYYEDTKTLAVVGGGAMYDYDSPEECEWYDLKNNIELVTVSGKVESVGENAFNGYPNLKEVYLGSSTQTVGENAFADCPNLSLVSSTASTLNIGANAFEGCNDRIKFVCYSANDGLLEFANEDDLIKVSFDPEQKALKFNGELTVYPDLNYEFLNRFLMNNNGAEYIFFSKLIFHGVEPDIVDVKDLENDASAQYLTFTNLYISLRAVKNGAQENITFGEMLELLEGGDYDAFIFDLNSDESNQEVTVPSWKKTIDNFIEDVVKAVSKLINFVAKLFRRK